MKRLICLFLSIALLFSLAGCAAPSRDSDTPSSDSRRRSSSPQHAEPQQTDDTPAPASAETHSEPESMPAPTEALSAPLPVEPLPEVSPIPEPESTPQPVSAWHEKVSVDPASLPDDLLGLLARFGWVGRTDLNSYWPTDVRCVLPVMNWGFELISAYDSYPGPASGWSNSDPLGRWDGCHVYDAEKTERILKTVYGVDDAVIDQLRAAGDDRFANFYYHDGSYYVTPLGVGGGFLCCPCYAEDDGVKLYIYYAVYYGDGMFYPAGLCYAEVSRAELDGQAVWSLDYWSRTLPVIGMPDAGNGAAVLGDWVLADDGLSSLRIDQHCENEFLSSDYRFYAGFFRLVGFDAKAQLISDKGIAMFEASDGSGFQGWMEISDDEIVLHIFSSPEPDGRFGFDGYFDGRPLRFVRPADDEPIAPDSFWISPDELEAEIVLIRSYYNSPTAADEQYVLNRGTDGWNYSREYYFHDGQLVFAFLFNGTEEHRLYFKDGHMIRYIDEYKTTYDFGALEPFAEWERRAITEAASVSGSRITDPSDWIGTWHANNGEWIDVRRADETGIQFVYHHNSELRAIDTFYSLPFLNAEHSFVAEDESLIAYGGWRYCFCLQSDRILVTSRYPDNYFYR